MLYLNENDLLEIGLDWTETIEVIRNTVKLFESDAIVQPKKPYLRFNNLKNRIIAMPAYVGGSHDTAGIKWISSFPDNINEGLPRASSIVILNNSDNGQIKALINGSLLSVIRTVSVSGLVMKYFCEERSTDSFNLGIIGWGPIGQHHYKMCRSLFKDKIDKIYLYDINSNAFSEEILNDPKTIICKNWKEAYDCADVFITCTVSSERYIDSEPRKGALLLNVSLRDYKDNVYCYVENGIVVDDWNEVCRENTDVELFYLNNGLTENDVFSLNDIVSRSLFKEASSDQVFMINPMGMAAFDISIGEYFFKLAVQTKNGLEIS